MIPSIARIVCPIPLLPVALATELSAQLPPYDVFPAADPPYYRVRYEASTQPGALVYPVNYTIWIPPGVKRPQMQWNKLSFTQPGDAMFEGELLRDAPNGSWVYFVHSLHGVPMDPSLVAATCDYGVTRNAAFRQDNVFATQFHPEKSGASGLALLDNFVKAAGAS